MNNHLPPGACDAHMHIFDERFTALPNALFRSAPVAAYRDLAAVFGIDRMVVVQPSGYGFDNSCTLDALARLGSVSRGVVVIPPDTPRAELDRLHALGVRGVRFMMALPGGLSWDSMAATADAVSPLGWHLNLQFDGHQLPERVALIQALPVDVVIDHYGAFHNGFNLGGPEVASLCRLLDTGKVWIKLASPYAYGMSRIGPPGFADVGRLASMLVSNYPDRCLWGSNWPHVAEKLMPCDDELLTMAREWIGDDAVFTRILVDNPARLYGFEEHSEVPRHNSANRLDAN